MKLYAYIEASGDTFSPCLVKVPDGFINTMKNEPNELGLKGRFKGLPIPYGYTRLIIPLAGDVSSFFCLKDPNLVQKIRECIDAIREAKGDDIAIHLDIEYQKQCNLQIESEWLIGFGQLAIPVAISTYENNAIDGVTC